MLEKTKQGKTIVTQVHSTEFSSTDSSYAFIHMDEKLLKTILGLKKALDLAIKDLGSSNVYQITAFNSACNYVNEQDNSTNSDKVVKAFEGFLNFFDDKFDKEEYARANLSDEFEEEIDLVDTSSNILVVTQHAFKFTSYIKHTGTKLTSETIPLHIVTDMLDELDK